MYKIEKCEFGKYVILRLFECYDCDKGRHLKSDGKAVVV
jgi:hypothetical protein